nr:hypothetical protein GCM10020092_072650 [Actinoplanes digitatis]
MEQLHPEFSEIELRIRGGEYAAALAVIERIDDGYLHGWGHSDAVVESLHGLADLDPRRELVRLSLLARALRQQEDHAGVIACVRPALRLATRRRVTTDRVRLIIQLANAYFEQGQLDLATAHYRKAAWLTRTRLRGLRQERAFVHAGLVLCAGRAGHLDRALRHHASALRLLRGTVEESEHRAALYISAAWVEGELGRTDAARVNLHRARSAADAAGDHILLGEAKQAEAEILLDEGGFVAAVALADQAAQA